MNTPDEVTGPINLGNPNEITIRQLAEQVVALTGSRSAIEYRELPPDDPVRRRPDIRKAREVLGWSPAVPLREGLSKTIDHFRAAIGVGRSTTAPVELTVAASAA
jgi:UDP-glucuronate decarboxylase